MALNAINLKWNMRRFQLLKFTFIIFVMLSFVLAEKTHALDRGGQETSVTTGLTTAYDARIVGDNAVTRIIIDFDKKPDLRFFYMQRPNRLIVELDRGAFRLAKERLETVGLINLARFGSITSEKARMVLSLTQPASIVSQDIQTFDDSTRQRLVLELQSVNEVDFAETVKSQQALLGASGGIVKKGERVRKAAKKAGVFTIVIDPGHGGIDGGAVGNSNTLEKNVTLKMAQLIAEQLKQISSFQIVFTRQDDVFISLKERLNFIKRQNADLVISLHADTLRQDYVRGATIYTLAKKASDKLAAQVESSENLTDIVAGLAAPDAREEVTDILTDLTLRETTRFSRAFSEQLRMMLQDKVIMIKNPQRSASFVILKNPDVPGVLLELGYLSNKLDEALLNDPLWYENIARQVSLAIFNFFKSRMPTANIK